MRKMKDSGIEWIGEIPEEWNLQRLAFCLQEVKVQNFPIKTTQVLSLVKDKGVMLYEEKGDIGNKAKTDVSEYKLAYPNTLVVNSMNILIGSVGISDYFGCVSPVYYVFRETDSSDLRYINYIFNTREFQKELKKYANGILEIRLRVSSNDIFKRKIPFPLKAEQHRIADFLDTKCARIDSLVTTIQSEIETLEQYKRSLITEAVTKGLDPKAEMKESGIEWIGEVPKEWNIVRGKYLFDNKKSIAGFSANLYDRLSLTMRGIIKRSKDDVDGLQPKDFESYQIVNKDDLVLRLIDLQNVSNSPRIGFSLYDGIISPAYIILKSRNLILPKYAFYFYYSLSKSNVFNFIGNSGVRSNLTIKDLAELQLPAPPVVEQFSIVDFLDSKCGKIDAIIDRLKNKLTDLESYKKSLIFEYVTGKKEVPAA